MSTHLLSEAARLSDRQLVAQVKDLVHRERSATAALIAHLAVLDERRLYLAEGSSSLFTYCVEILHLSEHAAYNRIEAARAARKYPIILDRLAAGDVHLTAVRLLAPHLTPENHVTLLDRARHLRAREVEEIVARLQPRPPAPSSIRRLPALAPAEAPVTAEFGSRTDEADQPPVLSLPQPFPIHMSRRPVVEPLAPGQYRVQFTADEETRRNLKAAQDLLRHRIPDGDLGRVIKLALRALLNELAKQKYAATDRPRAAGGAGVETRDASRSRHIPASVRRAVWERDNGRCAFLGADGQRCSERGFLEFHHVEPYAMGGAATVENIELRCRAHNGYAAERDFGRVTGSFASF